MGGATGAGAFTVPDDVDVAAGAEGGPDEDGPAISFRGGLASSTAGDAQAPAKTNAPAHPIRSLVLSGTPQCCPIQPITMAGPTESGTETTGKWSFRSPTWWVPAFSSGRVCW